MEKAVIMHSLKKSLVARKLNEKELFFRKIFLLGFLIKKTRVESPSNTSLLSIYVNAKG